MHAEKQRHRYACILEYTEANTHKECLGISRTGEYGSRGGRRGGQKEETCGREIKLEQTAAQIEGSGLPKERDQGGKKARQKRNE